MPKRGLLDAFLVRGDGPQSVQSSKETTVPVASPSDFELSRASTSASVASRASDVFQSIARSISKQVKPTPIHFTEGRVTVLSPYTEHVLNEPQDLNSAVAWVPGSGTSVSMGDSVLRVSEGPALVVGPSCHTADFCEPSGTVRSKIRISSGMVLVGQDTSATVQPAISINAAESVVVDGVVTNGSIVVQSCSGVVLRDCTVMGGVRVDDAASVQVEGAGGGAAVHYLEF